MPPPGDFIVYVYHPFDETVQAAIADAIVASVRHAPRRAFEIYVNPLHANVFDERELFKRIVHEIVPCAEDEVGYAPDDFDELTVWEAGLPMLRGTLTDDAHDASGMHSTI